MERVESVLRLLSRHHFDAILIHSPINLYYLTGLHLSRGYLLLTLEKRILWVDPRYKEVAQALSSDVEIFCHASAIETYLSIGATVAQVKGRVGFDASTMSVEVFQAIGSQTSVEKLVPAPALFSELRRPKRAEEIASIEEACRLCEQGFQHIRGLFREGITERELSQQLKAFWFAHGAEALSFEPIIAFGAHTACPHWSCSSTPLHAPSPILIDIGVQLHSYQSDMTRTLFFGEPDPELLKCHTLVQEAYELAFSEARPGVAPHHLDSLVRQFFSQNGFPNSFLHGLGHGVGLEVHEAPRISAYATDELPFQVGDVIAIEPGLYLPGRGGIRIENTVVIEAAGARSLIGESTYL